MSSIISSKLNGVVNGEVNDEVKGEDMVSFYFKDTRTNRTCKNKSVKLGKDWKGLKFKNPGSKVG